MAYGKNIKMSCGNCSRFCLFTDEPTEQMVSFCYLKKVSVRPTHVCEEWHPSLWTTLNRESPECQKQMNKK